MKPETDQSLPLASERRHRILERIEAQGVTRSSDLAAQFGVNVATIRRDLRVLASDYPIKIVHGGAALVRYHPQGVHEETDLTAKEMANIEAKRLIARKAAALVENGETIAINSGSTTAFMLDYLPSGLTDLTVVTLGLNVAQRAARLPFVTLFLPGGYYRRTTGALTGPTAVQVLQGIHVDRAFLGAVAVHIEAGWTHPTHVEVDTNQLLVRAAAKRYLMADSSKFGNIALARVCPLTDFNAFVVDADFPAEYREWAVAHDIEII